MTFSIIARDETGALGQAVASSSPAVAARCMHLRGNVGAVASQNITDPRFGSFLLDRLADGFSASDAFRQLAALDNTLSYRQITILPFSGSGYAYSGKNTLGIHHQIISDDCVVAGNMLAGEDVILAMLEAFEKASGELEYRLLKAMKAGQYAGGEAGPIHSVGLGVVRKAGWVETDLRVDWSEVPLEDLESLLDVWMPQRDDYVIRGVKPHVAPAYGVPGEK
ncbi:DUF1028 domain-containing protein [Corynebacterium sp. sy017]|uniref:DUF1028 domain-containing protein n=1 Tax=unclassified Corynebacterium TaxID=2624378 RepID=UPI0011846BD0|nr:MULTISPECIES: DUF1028 domain-containing protein [unclassified Corynebacterium]MBP3089133.1 DUF1028 domain-containing protein [Corynebacterium sp. sy017]TSD91446.1 DUF1028 domain-containing protein [Corynebacterium sp. SY003]